MGPPSVKEQLRVQHVQEPPEPAGVCSEMGFARIEGPSSRKSVGGGACLDWADRKSIMKRLHTRSYQKLG
jgi:hypothetical protein